MKSLHRTAVKAALALSVGSVLLSAPQAKAAFIPPNAFDPTTLSDVVAPAGTFSGTASGFNYAKARLRFTLLGTWTPSSFTGISLAGDGIASSISFGSLSTGAAGTFLTSYLPLTTSISSINFANSSLAFTIPGGIAVNGNSVQVDIQYADAPENNINTSPTFNIVTSSTPVPGPLPLLGAAAAFGCSRKLRKRIKQSV